MYILLVMAVAGFSALTGALAGGAVVTAVGIIPGQDTFFGLTGDQTVSRTGFFISKPGDQTTLEVVRGNQTIQVQVTLEKHSLLDRK